MHQRFVALTKWVIPAVGVTIGAVSLFATANAQSNREPWLTRAALLAASSEPTSANTLPAMPKSDDPNLRHMLPAFNPQLDAVRAPSGFGEGRIWHVGPERAYKKPSDVVRLVHDGDIVEIDAARYACDTGVRWSANYLTLLGVGGRATIDATNCEITGDKGIWNPAGNGLIVANIEFVGASGPSGNDAGIRYDGSGFPRVRGRYANGKMRRNGAFSFRYGAKVSPR